MHIKDKNVAKGEKLMADVDVNELKALTIEQLAALALETEALEKALKAHAKIVKEHVHKVYGPLCVKKRELEIKVAFMNAKLKKAKEVNTVFAALSKITGK